MSEQEPYYVYSERIEYGQKKEIVTREEALVYANQLKDEMQKDLNRFLVGSADIIELEKKGRMYVRVPVSEEYYYEE